MKPNALKISLAVALAFILLDATGPTALAGAIEEADLTPGGEVYEINRDAGGGLTISDDGAGEIWRVNPAGSTYTVFSGLGAVRDAQLDGSGRIWFADGMDTFGYVDPGTNKSNIWTVVSPEPINLIAIAFDGSGKVWIAEEFGATSKLNRFDPNSKEWCSYSLPGGSYAADLIYRDGFLWQGNWYANRIFRFDPLEEQLTYWNIGVDATPQGLAFDAAGHLWWADAKLAALVRLDPNPSSNEMTTFAVPTGTRPQMVEIGPRGLWYTESSGTIGSLDPDAAANITATLTVVNQNLPHDEPCINLGDSSEVTITTDNGTLQWETSTASEIISPAGWKIYRLPADSHPYGIAESAGAVWAADQGRQKLLHISPTRKTYLPLVRR